MDRVYDISLDSHRFEIFIFAFVSSGIQGALSLRDALMKKKTVKKGDIVH